MKKITLLTIILILLSSCNIGQRKREKVCREFLDRHYPGAVEVISVSEPHNHFQGKPNLSELCYSFKTPEGFEGEGKMYICWDYHKSDIDTYYMPTITMEMPEFVPKYTRISCQREKAFGKDKMVAIISIPERYDNDALECVTKYFIYRDGSFVEDWWIEYYVCSMSYQGPNYALVNARRNGSGIMVSTEFNKLTEVTSIEELSSAYKELVLSDATAYIIECYQYIGNSFQAVYASEDDNYYIITYADGKFQKPDRIKMINDTTFRYVEDTGEVFKMESDGLYCYSEGELAIVYNKIQL